MQPNFKHSLIVMGAVLASAAWHASAAGLDPADRARSVAESNRNTVDSGRYGSPMGYTPYDYAIRLCADTKSVNVRRLDIVRFVTVDGREFFWRFDSMRPEVFALARIAPAGVTVPSGTMVYLREEIPVAP
jgi:hypothetical protein